MVLNCSSDDLKWQQPWWILLISSIGFTAVLKSLIALLKWLYCVILRPEKDLKTSYGGWALITGATDGIGKAFAFRLAEKGMNLVLVSRDLGKLEMIGEEIRGRRHGIEIRVFEIDFARNDAVLRVEKMKEFIEGLQIGVLINNVGVTYPKAMFFHEVEERTWMKLVRVNVEGTTYVTRAVLPGMFDRRRGAVVNIGSGAAIIVPSHPLYAIYAATKAYVDQLARSLSVEYKQYGVDVQCQVPLYVSTKMATRVAFVEKPSVLVPSAERYAAAAVGFIGREGRCTPYWGHSVQWFLASLLPEALLDRWRLSVGIRRMELSH
ncbi:very-long-chain 3-oxoacyl-CoA reductase-like protein At1g24470 [Andrographis paniculata]|uniref:very-long-chain 3-oxoacyl-CoA reductase-like protein At1g24470 n=1 Tax=Andrographis paniculata TaxID=175694 RepID=UPI0021E7835C|nr:very-long-chain 3-oxoacyl-CoA reductase-like protein At1g24470 [Andrographis paniculata]